jgi:hypothetical protein
MSVTFGEKNEKYTDFLLMSTKYSLIFASLKNFFLVRGKA